MPNEAARRLGQIKGGTRNVRLPGAPSNPSSGPDEYIDVGTDVTFGHFMLPDGAGLSPAGSACWAPFASCWLAVSPLGVSGYMLQDVATMSEIADLALDLAENERAMLAANLLDSLPATLSDVDEGTAEAQRRDADLDAHPHEAISVEELETQIRHRHD